MLTTASLKLADLLSGPFLLNIPPYQRPYSWGNKQVQQLLDDLVEAAGLGSSDTVDDVYFLGNILLMDVNGTVTKRISAKMSAREFDVVDGQQRLVTLLTLFCLLRDLDEKKTIAKRVQAMVLGQIGSRFFGTERFRIQMPERDRALFEQSVLKEGGSLEAIETQQMSLPERAILAMRDLLASELQEMSSEDRARLFDFVAERCAIVLVVSHDIDNAQLTFIVLNERGKQLQRDDILKADILQRLDPSSVQWVADEWDRARTDLDADFATFFSHIHKIYGYESRQIVSGVRAVISDAGGPEAFIRDVFAPLAKSYQTVRTGTAPDLPATIVRRLKYLNRLADGDWAPPAMMALKDWQRNPERADALIGEIDRMAHLMRLLCAGTGKRVRRFADITEAIRSGAVVDERSPVFQLARDETRSIAFHLKDMHKRGPKTCKILLLRLSDIMSGNVQDVDPEAYTIEHILPQRPSATSEWRRLFPTAEERSQCVESLGNLVLITPQQNDKARNASFEAKKAFYVDGSLGRAPLLPITADVLSATEWRRREIVEREHRLLTMISNLWRIDVPLPKI